jgi:hypothetical protein
MNTNRFSFFWGILLIGAGALALARQLGYMENVPPLVWAGIFAAASLLALVNYALSGWKQWGWLFPTGIFGGLAVTVALASANIDNAAVASPLFLGLLLPFVAAYLSDRSRNWWALIPGAFLVFLSLVTLLVDSTAGDEWIGALSAGFLVVYLGDRTRLWALLVTYIIAVLGIAPLMSVGGRDAEYYGPIFLFAVALPFFFVYFRFVGTWWALIPAGTLTTVATIAALSIAGIVPFEWEEGFMTALLLAGLAVTFAVVWLRHDQAWARIVAFVLAPLAVASLFFVDYIELLWPIPVILAGIYLFYTALRTRNA